ncbi:MAG: nitrogen regulation protein NR(II) [Halobacteriales archaeon]
MSSVIEKYQALFELAPDPIFVIAVESAEIIEVNEEAAKLLATSVDTLEGTPVSNIHPDDETESYRALMQRTVNEGQIQATRLNGNNQLCIETADERSIPVELHARTFDLNGSTYIMTIARDISDRLSRKRELQRQNDHIADLVHIMSHDIRNPLNVALGNLQLAAKDVESEQLDRVQTALHRIEDLIEDTLILARQGEPVASKESIQLADYLDECWEMVETKEAALEVEVPDPVSIVGDPSRLHQVFENLFRNAIEHSEGPVTIRVGRIPSGIYVEDDGPGIPADELSEVFDSGYSGSDQGTGFGLTIVEEILEAHGWAIDVTSGSAGGARFEITGIEHIAPMIDE